MSENLQAAAGPHDPVARFRRSGGVGGAAFRDRGVSRSAAIFRDPADFAVLVLYDADNFYEHPRLKYLPDTDFSGLTLTSTFTTRG